MKQIIAWLTRFIMFLQHPIGAIVVVIDFIIIKTILYLIIGDDIRVKG